MACQWVICRNGEGCDVLWREGLGPEQRRALLVELLSQGLSSREADVEIRLKEGGFTRCNKTAFASRAASVEFVLGYAKPGDVLVDHGTLLVLMAPARV
jgi:hypothetical protein